MTTEKQNEIEAQIGKENNAWSEFCRCYSVINGNKPYDRKCQILVSFIRLWGEELAELRRLQGEEGEQISQGVKKVERDLLIRHGIEYRSKP